MDWNNIEAEEKVAIAIAKMPAKVHVTDPRYGDSILVNPGFNPHHHLNFLS
jgi:hypothetical protein